MLKAKGKRELYTLKATIKGCASESVKLTSKLSKTSDVVKKSILQMDKDLLSRKIRHFNIAYGLLRGKAYKEIERKAEFSERTTTLNYAYGHFIDVAYLHSIIKVHSYHAGVNLTTENIKDWIEKGTKLFLTQSETHATRFALRKGSIK